MVEDDPNDALLVRMAFQRTRSGIPLIILPNGLEAINYLQGEGVYADRAKYPIPDIILLDLKMPLMSGFDVLRWIRERPGLKRLPVIVLTSSVQDADARTAYDAGANSYLVKPTDFNELVESIKNLGDFWLDGSKLPQTAQNAPEHPEP
ncbi:MAG TPA: response regulator [Methylomirabilota bacterium]|nr:response regulator [Methylomirabilota bacterium]